jgi:hypothetical protein
LGVKKTLKKRRIKACKRIKVVVLQPAMTQTFFKILARKQKWLEIYFKKLCSAGDLKNELSLHSKRVHRTPLEIGVKWGKTMEVPRLIRNREVNEINYLKKNFTFFQVIKE